MKHQLTTFALGTIMGTTLSLIGFSSWDEVHRMFLFADLRLTLTFAVAVIAMFVGWRLLQHIEPGRVRFASRPVHRGTIIGGCLFGAGWALCGACPSIALVQLGEGQLAALITLSGVFAGNWLSAHLRERYLSWDYGSCND